MFDEDSLRNVAIVLAMIVGLLLSIVNNVWIREILDLLQNPTEECLVINDKTYCEEVNK